MRALRMLRPHSMPRHLLHASSTPMHISPPAPTGSAYEASKPALRTAVVSGAFWGALFMLSKLVVPRTVGCYRRLTRVEQVEWDSRCAHDCCGTAGCH